MKQKRIKVRLTADSPYSEYGFYAKEDVGYVDGYTNGCAVVILENGKFAKAELNWIEVVNKEDAEHYFPELKESDDERIRKELLSWLKSKDGQTLAIDKYNAAIAWLEKQSEPQDKGEISDGYHTFNELYYYRMLYNAAFFNMLPKEWVHKSKKHHDGEECFGGGWFIVMANLPTGQISNHYELKDWDLFQIPEKETADEWDGHTPQEAAERLRKYLQKK